MFEHIQALKQLNNAENVYGREIGILNDTINNERIRSNELRHKRQELNDIEQESSDIIDELSNKIDKLQNKKTNLKNDNNKLQKALMISKIKMINY